jgi:Flp pilus assembly protein TadG
VWSKANKTICSGYTAEVNMHPVKNECGSVLVFITLMIVLLMIMVGMGLDTGHLGYSRATGQAAVDAAALSAVSALPARVAAEVESRAAVFNSTNNYTGSLGNTIKPANVSYIQYDFTTRSAPPSRPCSCRSLRP